MPTSSLLPTRSQPTLREFDGHPMVIALNDAVTGLRGFIAVHSTRHARAVGGTRWLPYGSTTEAVEDALRLSRAMSYKCALAGLPYGGAKAVVIGDPTAKTTAQLMAYGRLVDELGGLFKTGTDVGVTDQDVLTMARSTRHMIGAQTLADSSLPTTSAMAAQGVFYAIQASLGHRTGNSSVNGRTVTVKGLGKLGGRLVELLVEAGAQVIVGDIDPARVAAITRRLPELKVASPEYIHGCSADVYAPCALGHELTDERVRQLGAGIVTGGANNQLASPAIGEWMHRNGILFAPDYIANAGGLIHVTAELEPGGYNRATVEARTKQIADTLTQIYQLADSQDAPTDEVARQLAMAVMKGEA